jgi:voltage-gated potassium channel
MLGPPGTRLGTMAPEPAPLPPPTKRAGQRDRRRGDRRRRRPRLTAATTAEPVTTPQRSNAYEIFILVLTVQSLIVMGLVVLPLDAATHQALTFFDNVICVIFLGDFALNLAQSSPKGDYFITRRGWLDLLGSVPAFGVFRFTALFRLARLSRLARITRLLRGQNQGELVRDVVENRGQYALFITFLAAFLVLTFSSVLILQFESRSPDANITTGGDALWWAFVTITTVGYGDYYPVTTLGRTTAVFVMFAGVGIIGSLASILASILVPDSDGSTGEPEISPVPASDASVLAASETRLEAELAQIRTELASMRELLAARPD